MVPIGLELHPVSKVQAQLVEIGYRAEGERPREALRTIVANVDALLEGGVAPQRARQCQVEHMLPRLELLALVDRQACRVDAQELEALELLRGVLQHAIQVLDRAAHGEELEGLCAVHVLQLGDRWRVVREACSVKRHVGTSLQKQASKDSFSSERNEKSPPRTNWHWLTKSMPPLLLREWNITYCSISQGLSARAEFMSASSVPVGEKNEFQNRRCDQSYMRLYLLLHSTTYSFSFPVH